jgi:hypothetical protein
MPYQPHFLSSDRPNVLWEGVQIMELLTVKFSLVSSYSIALISDCSPQKVFSVTTRIFLLKSETEFYTHSKLREEFT